MACVAAHAQAVTVTVVQPNISQSDKYALGYDAVNFAKLAMNSRPLPDQGPRLILWPEGPIVVAFSLLIWAA